MTPNQIAQAAEKLANARLENKRIERLSGELRPQDRETAVAIQDELAKLVGHIDPTASRTVDMLLPSSTSSAAYAATTSGDVGSGNCSSRSHQSRNLRYWPA